MKLDIWDEKGQKVRSWSLSHTSLRLLGALLGMFMIFTSVMTWGFLHYRSKGLRLESSSVTAFEQEKAKLISKISGLESTIARIEKFTEKLETSNGVETDKLKLGLGPVAEHNKLSEFLGQVKKLPNLSPRLTHRDWRAGKFDDHFYDKMSLKMEDLSEYAANLELRVNEVYDTQEDRISYWASVPSTLPVQGWVTSGFGYRFSPWGGGTKLHEGVDIAAAYGSAIYAPSDGTVVFAGTKGGYGNALIIDHGYGISTLYGHTSQLFVSEGQRIARGTRIASVGNSGASTGPHLHYEVRVDGIPTDPAKYYKE